MDINECLTNNGGCDQNAQCINEEGSFKVSYLIIHNGEFNIFFQIIIGAIIIYSL